MGKEKNILKNLSKMYFQGIADDISSSKTISSIFPNMSDVGDIRENIVLKFLTSHLPLRCSVVKGGSIFDSECNESKQIDLLVVNDSSLRFSYFDRDAQNSKNIQTIEGCLAAISIKSTLDREKLYDALENLSTIPKMPDYVIDNINPSIRSRELYLDFPLKIIFSYNGLDVSKTLTHINNFYSENSFQDHQKANLIIVNNSFCIEKIGKDGGTDNLGRSVSEGIYYPSYTNDGSKFGSYPLFRLLMEIQKTTAWSPHVFLNYNILNQIQNTGFRT